MVGYIFITKSNFKSCALYNIYKNYLNNLVRGPSLSII